MQDGTEVLAYDHVEAFAEKFRARAEHTRPCDLDDVVNLYRSARYRTFNVPMRCIAAAFTEA